MTDIVTTNTASIPSRRLKDMGDGTYAEVVYSGGSVFNGAAWDSQKKPGATSRIPSSAASTNATVAKASAGDIFALVGYNANAAARYLKIYNKATAPVVGTDTPFLTIPLPPSAAFAIDFHLGLYCSAGISYALTTGAADADTGAVGAADILGLNIAYA